MYRLAASGIVALLIAFPAWGAAPPKKRNAKAELEALSGKLEFFRTWYFTIANDHHYNLPQKFSADYEKALQPVRQRAYREADLVELLAHRDPRVRTLAAAGLFAHENPRHLVRMKPLLDDKSLTFLTPAERFGFFDREETPEMEEQTVGEVVRTFVRFYLDLAGHPTGDHSAKALAKALDDYWAIRKDRTFCASWFGVRLYRASQGTLPTAKGRYKEVAKGRAAIDRLPTVDRALTLLWLRSELVGGEVVVSEKDLAAACEQLGRDRLLDLLRRKRVSTDPDLDPERNGRLLPMQLFVLRYAKELFGPKDADVLLDCMQAKGNYPWADWYIAAASVDPKRSREILDRGWKAKQGSSSTARSARIDLTLARWRLVREETPALVVKRFYSDEPEWAAFPTPRAHFLERLGEKWEARDRKLLGALIADKQFDSLEWQSLQKMVRLVNRVEKKVVISEDDLRKAWHPLGMGHAEWPQMEAEKKHPKETAELQGHLKTWREALRKHFAK